MTEELVDLGDKEILEDSNTQRVESLEFSPDVLNKPLRLVIEPETEIREHTFQSIPESVHSLHVEATKFETNKRRASCCSRLTFCYANSLVESVQLNKGKISHVMVEEMSSDSKRDE